MSFPSKDDTCCCETCVIGSEIDEANHAIGVLNRAIAAAEGDNYIVSLMRQTIARLTEKVATLSK